MISALIDECEALEQDEARNLPELQELLCVLELAVDQRCQGLLHVHALRGTTPPNPKPPQGAEYKEAAAGDAAAGDKGAEKPAPGADAKAPEAPKEKPGAGGPAPGADAKTPAADKPKPGGETKSP